MKQTVKTSRTAGYLEKMFRRLNEQYFNGELTEPIITVAPTKGAYGHCTVGEIWSKATGDSVREINIASGTLARPIEETVATLLHEMVHLYNLENNIQDTSRGGSYHNKKFKQAAECRGLKIDHHPTYGWTITSPTEELIEFIISEGWNDIAMNRLDIEGYSRGKGGTATGGMAGIPIPKKTNWKWTCPSCGLIARTTCVKMEGQLVCGICGVTMFHD